MVFMFMCVCGEEGGGNAGAGKDSAITALLPGSMQCMWQVLSVKEELSTPQRPNITELLLVASPAERAAYCTQPTYSMSVGPSYERTWSSDTASSSHAPCGVDQAMVVAARLSAFALHWEFFDTQ